jgi:hypothetical protein
MKYIYNILVIVLILAAVGVSGCLKETQLKDDPHQTNEVCTIQDFGNGTLYFGCNDIVFVKSLSEYIGKNKVTVNAITPVLAVQSYNSEKGYIVVVTKG